MDSLSIEVSINRTLFKQGLEDIKNDLKSFQGEISRTLASVGGGAAGRSSGGGGGGSRGSSKDAIDAEVAAHNAATVAINKETAAQSGLTRALNEGAVARRRSRLESAGAIEQDRERVALAQRGFLEETRFAKEKVAREKETRNALNQQREGEIQDNRRALNIQRQDALRAQEDNRRALEEQRRRSIQENAQALNAQRKQFGVVNRAETNVAGLEQQNRLLAQARASGLGLAEAMRLVKRETEAAAAPTREIANRIRAAHAESERLNKSFGDGGGGLLGRIGSFILRFTAFTVAAGVLIRVVFGIQQAITGIVERAINFQRTMENASFALTAILTNSRQLQTSTGSVANLTAAYPVFLEKAKRFQQELLILNIKTLGTGEELQGVFQRVLAFSQTQKANDEERFKLTQNITNAAKLLGLTGEQINTETRQLLTLESERGQTILQSLGVTAKQLRVYRDQGTLIQELNKLLNVYSIIADDVALTFDGLVSTVSTFVDLVAGAAFEQTFSGLKDILKGAADELQRLTKSGNLFVGLDSTTEELKAFGAAAANSFANFIRLIAEATNAIIDFSVKHRDSIQFVISAFEGFARVLAAPFNILDSLITKVGEYINVLIDLGKTIRDLPSGEFFFQNQLNGVAEQAEATKQAAGSGRTGQAIGGAVVGAGAAASLLLLGKVGVATALALNPIYLILGAIAGAAIAVDIQIKKSRESLNRFGELKSTFIGLATAVDVFGASTPKTVDELNEFLKQSAEITKQLDLLKNKFATSGQEGADVFVDLLQQMIEKIATTTDNMEAMKASLTALIPEETLEALKKLGEQLDKASIAAKTAQGLADIQIKGVAAGKSEGQIEIEGSRFEATNKFSPEEQKEITKQIEERNKAVRQSVELQEQYNKAIAAQGNFVQVPEIAKNLDAISAQLEDTKVFGGITNFDEFTKSLGDFAEQEETANQRREASIQGEKDRKRAIEESADALTDLGEKLAQVERKFEEELGKFSLDSGSALEARFQEIGKEAEEETRRLSKSFKGNVPPELTNEIDKISIAKGRLATIESIRDEEALAQKRISIAQETQEALRDIAESEVEVQRTASKDRLEALQQELNFAEQNAGISGKNNNSLEDRARLIRAVAEEEVKLIQLDQREQELNAAVLRSRISTLADEIGKLEERRRDTIKFIQESGNFTPNQEKQLNIGFDFGKTELTNELNKAKGDLQETEATFTSLGNESSRVLRQMTDDIDDLGRTIIDLNNPIANLAGNLFDAFQKGGKGIKNVFKTLQKDIQQSFSDAFRESLKKKFQFDVEFKGNIFDLGGYFKDTFSEAVSFVGNLFSQAGGSGQGGWFNSLSSIFGSGSGGSSAAPAGGGSSLFGGGGSDLGSTFGFGSGGDQSSWLTKLFGGTSFGGSSGAPTGGWQQAPGGTFGGIPSGGSSAVMNGGQGFGSGAGTSTAGSYAGIIQAAARAGFNFSEGNYGAGAGGVVGGAIGAYFGGPQGAAIGAQIGEMIGGIFDSIVDLFNKPGRIEKEKKKIIKFYEEVLDIDFDKLKEKKVAGGFEEFKGPTSAAAIALGSKFASEQKNPTQGTVVRFAGQGLGNFKKAGFDTEEAQEAILDLAQAMDFDIKEGVKSLKANMNDGVLSLKTFKEELREAKKNLKEYGDTSNLTAKELSDLATANGNTGSRLVTINEVLAGTIDIYAEFDEFIDGATLANGYLADSFVETAKATDLFNADVENLAEQIESGKLSLEEATIELNKFRKEAGLAALDLNDFKISAKDIQEQVDLIKKAVQTLRDALKSGLLAGVSATEFKKEDIEKGFKKSVYRAMVDAVAEGMVDGIIKGSLAAGPLSAAFQSINDLTSKFVAGDISEGDFFAGLEDAFTAAGPAVDRLAIALGTSSEYLRQMLADAGVLPFLLGEATVAVSELEQMLHDAGKSAILEGIRAPEFDRASVEKSFRRTIYGTLVDTIVDGFIDGFIKATLATGPLEVAMKNIRGLIDQFVAGDLNFDEFGQLLSGELGNIAPLIERIAAAVGLTTEALREILDAAGILPDILDEASSNAEDLAKELRKAAKDLLLDSTLSPLKPKQRVAEAQANFEDLRRRALAGDEEAARLLPEAARQFLEEARKVFASSAQYEVIFDFVRGTLLEVADKFGPLEDTEEKQLRTLEDVRAYLKTIDINLAKLSGGDSANLPDSDKPGRNADPNDGRAGDRLSDPNRPGRNASLNDGREGDRLWYGMNPQDQQRSNNPNDGRSGDRLYDALNPGRNNNPNDGRAGDRFYDALNQGRGGGLNDGKAGDRLYNDLNMGRNGELGATNTILQDTQNLLESTLDELGLAATDSEREAAEFKVINVAQLLALQTASETLFSVDKTLKKIGGISEEQLNNQVDAAGRKNEDSDRNSQFGRNNFNTDPLSGDRLGNALNANILPKNTPKDTEMLLLGIGDSLNKLVNLASGSNVDETLSAIRMTLDKSYEWLVFATTNIYAAARNSMNLLSQIAKRPPGTLPWPELSEGGIITGREVPALLHGPEVVIPLERNRFNRFMQNNGGFVSEQVMPMFPSPESVTPLPHRASSNITVSTPELIAEVRGLRAEMRNMPTDSNQRPIVVQGDFNVGQVKLGEFVQKTVQGALNNQQIRVPQKSIQR